MITEVLKQINWLSVIIGAIGYFALGAIWYSFLFKEKWIKYTGFDMTANDARKGAAAIMFGSFVMMFVSSVAIAFLAYRIGMWGFMSGIKLGLLTGVCFAFTSIAINMLYEKKPAGLYFINGGYQILGNIIAAVIIVGWR